MQPHPPPVARSFAQPDQGVGVGKGQRPQQHEIRDGERGGIGADAKRGDQDGGERKAARAVEGANGVAQVLLQDVPVGGRCIHDDLVKSGEPQREERHTAGGAQLDLKDGRHLLAVVRAERGGIQVEKKPVDPHHAFRGASPFARARSSICASRRASAMATSRPNGVIR